MRFKEFINEGFTENWISRQSTDFLKSYLKTRKGIRLNTKLKIEKELRNRISNQQYIDFKDDEQLASKYYDSIKHDNFTKEQDLAWQYYKTAGYNDINGYLRGNKEQTEFIKHYKIIENLDSMMKPIPENMTVYRGVRDKSMFKDLKLKQGEIIEDKGYFSTTLIRDIAATRMRANGLLMKLKLSKGMKAIIANKGEYEILLPRNLKFKILNISEYRNKPFIEVQIV